MMPARPRGAVVWPWLSAHWNWKSALTSAASRSLIFLAANATGGWNTAMAAMWVEFGYRAFISGWFGALTERVGRRTSMRPLALAVLIVASTAAHVIEAMVHASVGTPHLRLSIIGSLVMTIVTTSFNLFAMRRGALIVGVGRMRLRDDLRALPSLIAEFISTIGRWCTRVLRLAPVRP